MGLVSGWVYIPPDPPVPSPVIQVANPPNPFQEADSGLGRSCTSPFADSPSSQHLCPPPTDRLHLLRLG